MGRAGDLLGTTAAVRGAPPPGPVSSETDPHAWHSPQRPTHLDVVQPHSTQRNAGRLRSPRAASARPDAARRTEVLVTGRTVAVGTDTAVDRRHDAAGAARGRRVDRLPSVRRPAGGAGVDGMSETAHHRGSRPGARPAWVLPVAVVAAVVVVAGIVVGIVLSQRSGKGTATGSGPASTVHLPSPTPTLAPVPRQATSAFAKALPTSVLQYALATSAADVAWQNAGAVEAWEESFTDGASGTLKLRSGQWETADEAKAFAATLVKAVAAPAPTSSATSSGAATPAATSATTPAPGGTSAGSAGLPRSGDVTVGGATVGTFQVVDSGDGTGTAVWTNGSSVFMLVAPVADAYPAYTAFPL